MILRILIFFSIKLFTVNLILAQVPNDNIAKRVTLVLGEEVASHTKNCTVQWRCVDESLTGKCIDYHNDQWFEFNTGSFNHLYFMVTSQQCRDLRGVQLVLIDGTPCKTETYKVLECKSLGTNNDFYIEADVKSGTNYLINIDGYLEDHCQFNILVDTIPRGLPAEQNLQLLHQAFINNDNVVNMNWQLDKDVDAPHNFIIYKRKKGEKRFYVFDSLAVERDAFGNFRMKYQYQDTVNEGATAFYLLILKDTNDKQYWFAEHSFTAKKSVESKVGVDINFNCPPKSNVTIMVYDQWQVDVLQRLFTRTDDAGKNHLYISLQKFADEGYKKVVVQVYCNGQPNNSYQVDLTK